MTKEANGLDNMVEQIGWCPFAIDGKGTRTAWVLQSRPLAKT